MNAALINWTVNQLSAQTFMSYTHCNSSASPAACTKATAGHVQVPIGATSLVVDTSALGTTTEINVFYDDSFAGCTLPSNSSSMGLPRVTARSSGISFTITLPTAPAGNPQCLGFTLENLSN